MENLTGMVRKSENYYFAFGGAADVWKGEWIQHTKHSTRATVVSKIPSPTLQNVILHSFFIKLAIKTIRSVWHDPQYIKTLNTVRPLTTS
jgi:hypothetical protein